MRAVLEKIIRRRNPNFKLHSDISSLTMLSFFWINFWSVIRGWKLVFKGKNPKMAIMGRNVRFFNSSSISFGNYLKLGEHVYINALGRNGIVLGNNVGIGAFSRVIVSTTFENPGAFIKIGNNVGIGEYAYLGGAGGLEIGDDCIIGQYFSCHPENHIADNLEIPIRHQGVSRKGIKIGEDCWIGTKVTILDGVCIGKGSIIAAGAVVTQSFPDYSVIGGVPAKFLKSRQ